MLRDSGKNQLKSFPNSSSESLLFRFLVLIVISSISTYSSSSLSSSACSRFEIRKNKLIIAIARLTAVSLFVSHCHGRTRRLLDEKHSQPTPRKVFGIVSVLDVEIIRVSYYPDKHFEHDLVVYWEQSRAVSVGTSQRVVPEEFLPRFWWCKKFSKMISTYG